MNKLIKITKNIAEDNKGTALLMAILILTSMLTVSLAISEMVMSGLKSSGAQARSTKAYYAAEAGAEHVLWEVRQDDLLDELPDSGTENDVLSDQDYSPLSNGAEYTVNYTASTTGSVTEDIFKSIGSYEDTKRSVEVSWTR